MSRWSFTPAQSGLASWAGIWQDANSAWYGRHPLFDMKFIGPLVRHFATPQTLYAEYRSGGEPLACLLLERVSSVRWRLFTPSQACLGSALFSPSLDAAQLREALSRLVSSLPAPVMILDLLKQDPSSSPLPALEWDRLEHGVAARTCNVRLRGTFEEYWSARPKRIRQDMRRVERRLQETGTQCALRLLSDADEMHAGVSQHGELEHRGWKGREGTALAIDNPQGAFYLEVMRAFAAEGGATVSQLLFDDRVVASLLIVGQGDMRVVLKTAHDETRRELSPGRFIDYRTMQEFLARPSGQSFEMYTNASDTELNWWPESRGIVHSTMFRSPVLKTVRRWRTAWAAA